LRRYLGRRQPIRNVEIERAAREIADILHRVDPVPVLDGRLPDEILGYNEHGLPT
jgi:hypothetical protein